MKALLIIITTLFFNVFNALAGPTVVGDLTFSALLPKRVGVSFNTDGIVTPQDHDAVAAHLDKCFNSNTHPLEWANGLHQDFNFFFKIAGPHASVLKAIDEHKTQANKQISWIWAGAKNPSINIYLKQDGTGFVTLHQGKLLVGHSFCRSTSGDARPHAEQCKVIKVHRQPAPKEYAQNDEKSTFGRPSYSYESWMPWALETDNSSEGIFLHGGSQASSSRGCIRMPKKFAEMLWQITKVGAEITITLEK